MTFKFKINRDVFRAVILFATVCEFPIFERLSPSIGVILSIVRFIVLVYCVFRSVYTNRMKKSDFFNNFHLCFLAYCITGAVSTFIATPSMAMDYVIHYLYPYVYTLIIFETIFNDNKYFNRKLGAISKYLGAAVWINFATMMIWRKGIIVSTASSMHDRANWIFGSKNNIVPFLPIVLCIIGMDLILNKQQRKNTLFNYATLGIAFVSFSSMGDSGFEFMAGSTTALIEMLVFFLAIFLFTYIRNTKFARFFTMKNICIFSMILMAIIVDISQGSGGIISYVISLLGKDTGFTGRYSVWTSAIDAIKESPIFGIGLEERIFRTWNNRWSYNTTIYSYWLSIGVRFGILGIILNFMMYATSDRGGNSKDPLNFMCKLCFLIMMIGGLTSTINIRYWMMILMIIYLWNQIGYKNNEAYIERYYNENAKRD